VQLHGEVGGSFRSERFWAIDHNRDLGPQHIQNPGVCLVVTQEAPQLNDGVGAQAA